MPTSRVSPPGPSLSSGRGERDDGGKRIPSKLLNQELIEAAHLCKVHVLAIRIARLLGEKRVRRRRWADSPVAMKLYLIRHATAAAESESAGSDPGLAEKAKTRLVRVAQGLAKMNVKPNLIVAGPAGRTRETAAIISESFGELRVEALAELAPEIAPETLLESLRAFSGLESLAIVGQQPQLGRLASLLITGSAELCELNFKKSAAACLSGRLSDAPGRFTLEWLIPPKALRRL